MFQCKLNYFVSAPKNAPAADEIASRRVAYSHFVFRFDFKDWKVRVKLHNEFVNNLYMFKIESSIFYCLNSTDDVRLCWEW